MKKIKFIKMNKKVILLFFWIFSIKSDGYANNSSEKLLLKENNFSLGYNSSERKYYVFYYDRYYTRDDNSKEWIEFPITYNDFPNPVSFGRLDHIEKKALIILCSLEEELYTLTLMTQ